MLAPLILFVGALGFQAADATATSKVTGRVVDAVTGAPLRKANVTISGVAAGRGGTGGGGQFNGIPPSPGARSLTTDSNGQFLAELAPGNYLAQAQRNGYVETPAATATFTIAAGETPAVTLKLTPHGVVSGRVVDEEGEPVAHAQVQALRWMSLQGRPRTLQPNGYSSTNDLGEFRIFGLAPGRFLLSAQAGPAGPPGARAQASPRQAYTEVYFPGVTDAASAQALEVTPGSVRAGVEIRLVQVAVVSILGKVSPLPVSSDPVGTGPVRLNPAGLNETGPGGYVPERRSGMNVHITLKSNRPGSAQPHYAQPNGRGEFQFNDIPSGSYTLTASTQNHPQDRRSARLTLEVGTRDITNVALTLEPLPTLRGRIRCEEPVPLAAMSFFLDPKAGAPVGVYGRSDAQGQFEITNLERLAYRPRVAGLPRGYYVKSIQLGSFDVTDTLDATAGVAGEVTVTLAKGTAEVSGLVLSRDQKPASGILVLLLNARREVVLSRPSNALGQYSLKEVQPGDYRLALATSTEFLADADTVERLYLEGQSLTLAPDARESRRLALP